MSTHKNPFGLRYYLVFFMMLNVVFFVYGLLRHKTILLQNVLLSPLLLNVEMMTVPFTLVSCIALWHWQRWGLWLVTVFMFIVFSIESYTEASILRIFGVAVSYGLLCAFLYPHWKKLS